MKEEKSLVGKLTDVKKGDRIRIWRETSSNSRLTYEAIGYVSELDEDYVLLSTDSPINKPIVDSKGGFFFRSTKYWLCHFSNFEKQIDSS